MSKYCRRKRVYEARCDLASQRSQMAPLRDHSCKVCIKSPCTVSTALLALIEVHGLLIQTLLDTIWEVLLLGPVRCSQVICLRLRVYILIFFPIHLTDHDKTIAKNWSGISEMQ